MKLLSKTLVASAIVAFFFSVFDAFLHYFLAPMAIDGGSMALLWYALEKFAIVFVFGAVMILILNNFWIKRTIKAGVFGGVIGLLSDFRLIAMGNQGVLWHIMNIIAHSLILSLLAWIVFKVMKVK